MRKTLQIVSWGSLIAMMVGPLMYLVGSMTLPTVKLWMLVFTVVWFGTVPLWMGRRKQG